MDRGTATTDGDREEDRRPGDGAVGHLDTFSSQAPGFYESIGYQPFGELPDYLLDPHHGVIGTCGPGLGQPSYLLRRQFVMMRFRPSAKRPAPSICPSGVSGE